MSESTASRWSLLFWIAAAYNLFGAAGPLLMPKLFSSLFFVSPPKTLSVVASLHLQFAWVSVLLFGLGYCIVALNPAHNRGIVLLAILGKFYVGILFFLRWQQGHLQFAAMLGGLGDLVFVVLFGIFLFKTRAQARVLPRFFL